MTLFRVRTIGTVCGNLLCSCGSPQMRAEKMFESQVTSYAKSGFGRFSRRSTWWERRQKRREDKECEQEEEQFGLGEGSFQTYWTMSSTSRCNRINKRDEELKRLCRLV